MRQCDNGYFSESLPLMVVGAPGCGKTSLLAAFAKRYVQSRCPAAAPLVPLVLSGDGLCRYLDERPNVLTLIHIVSASPTSTDIREVLIRLCREFKSRFPSMEWNEVRCRCDCRGWHRFCWCCT
jgi:hypothetical protein